MARNAHNGLAYRKSEIDYDTEKGYPVGRIRILEDLFGINDRCRMLGESFAELLKLVDYSLDLPTNAIQKSQGRCSQDEQSKVGLAR